MLPSMPLFLEGFALLGGEEELAPLQLGHLAPGSILPFHVFVADGFSPGSFVLAYRQGQVCPMETEEGGGATLPRPRRRRCWTTSYPG